MDAWSLYRVWAFDKSLNGSTEPPPKEARRITFFQMTKPKTSKEKPKLHDSDMTNRKIITAMLEADEALTSLEIAARAKTGKSNTYDTLWDFVRAGLAAKQDKATYPNIIHHRFVLTEDGVNIALAVGFETLELPAKVYETAMRKTLQPNPRNDPYHAVMTAGFLTALDRGLLNVLMVINHQSAVLRENGVFDMNMVMLEARAMFSDKTEILRQCLLNAIPTLNESDLMILRRFIKNQMESAMFTVGEKARDRKLMELGSESSQDPYNVIIGFRCRLCRYYDPHLVVPIETATVDAILARGIKCPNPSCGKYPFDMAVLANQPGLWSRAKHPKSVPRVVSKADSTHPSTAP